MSIVICEMAPRREVRAGSVGMLGVIETRDWKEMFVWGEHAGRQKRRAWMVLKTSSF